MRKLTLIITLLLLSNAAFCQFITVKEKNSFYFGKRFTIDANLATQIALQPQKVPRKLDLTPNRYSSESTQIFVHANPEFKVGFALTNKIGLYAKYSRSKRSRITSSDGFWYSPRGQTYEKFIYEYGNPLMKGNQLGVGFSFFLKKKAALAPIGSHFSIGYSNYKYNVTYDDMFFSDNESRYNKNQDQTFDVSDYDLEISHSAIDFEYTLREPITELLYYNISFSSSINIGARSLFGAQGSINDFDDALEEADRQSFLLKDVAVLKFGIGVVIF